jgi:dsDNA-binding SOS-regulon protein
MAVIVKYVVVRNGVEKMTFTSKKEADAYDKELDIAEELFELMQHAELVIEENALNELALFLARQREAAIRVLKGVRPKQPSEAVKAEKAQASPPETPPHVSDDAAPPTKMAKKGRSKSVA